MGNGLTFLALCLGVGVTLALQKRTGTIQLVPHRVDHVQLPIAFHHVPGFYLSRKLTVGFLGNAHDPEPLRVSFNEFDAGSLQQHYIQVLNADGFSDAGGFPPVFLKLEQVGAATGNDNIFDRSFSFSNGSTVQEFYRNGEYAYSADAGDIIGQRFCLRRWDGRFRLCRHFEIAPTVPESGREIAVRAASQRFWDSNEMIPPAGLIDRNWWRWRPREEDHSRVGEGSLTADDLPRLWMTGSPEQHDRLALDFIFNEDPPAIQQATNAVWRTFWQTRVHDMYFHRKPRIVPQNSAQQIPVSFIVAPFNSVFNVTLQYNLKPDLTIGSDLHRRDTGQFWMNQTGEVSRIGEKYFSISSITYEKGVLMPAKFVVLRKIPVVNGSPSHQMVLSDHPEAAPGWKIIENNRVSHRHLKWGGQLDKPKGFFPIVNGRTTSLGLNSTDNAHGRHRMDRMNLFVFPLS